MDHNGASQQSNVRQSYPSLPVHSSPNIIRHSSEQPSVIRAQTMTTATVSPAPNGAASVIPAQSTSSAQTQQATQLASTEQSMEMRSSADTIELQLNDKPSLYAAYMPFIKQGGLFIRTKQSYVVGDALSLTVRILEDPQPFSFTAKVVWITPMGAQGGLREGVGVQFPETPEAETLRKKIETSLAGALQADRRTDTM